MYFLAAKSTKNSPTDALCLLRSRLTFETGAYSRVCGARRRAASTVAARQSLLCRACWPSLQANLPRFFPLLAGPSFDGSGIVSEYCASSSYRAANCPGVIPPLRQTTNRRTELLPCGLPCRSENTSSGGYRIPYLRSIFSMRGSRASIIRSNPRSEPWSQSMVPSESLP